MRIINRRFITLILIDSLRCLTAESETILKKNGFYEILNTVNGMRDDSGFLPPSKNMLVRVFDDSKLSLGVSVSVNGCLSRLSLCGPVMDWRPVQGVPRLSPEDCWDRLQPTCDPTEGLSGRKWMDGWYERWERSLLLTG